MASSSPHAVPIHDQVTTLGPVAGPLHDTCLQAALAHLDGAVDEAREEGFETVPSEAAIKNARRVLQCMYALRQLRLEVYPMQDGAVAIAARGGPRRSVLVLCDGDGGALCSVNVNDLHRRAVYDSAATLPDGFVREALAELDHRP